MSNSTVTRRRSIFDNDEQVENEVDMYPLHYVAKIKEEIEQWKNNVLEAAEEKRSTKKQRLELRNTELNESCLSQEQLEYIQKIDNNIRRDIKTLEEICNQIVIKARVNTPIVHLKEKINSMQEEIENRAFRY